MAFTHMLIQTLTASSGSVANFEFTSIPQIYKDLLFVVSGRATTDNPTLQVYFNNDTNSANYQFRTIDGNGSSVANNAGAQPWLMRVTPSSATAGIFGNGVMYIANYAGTTYQKSVSADSVTENNGTTAYNAFHSGLWLSTAAITSIKLDPFGTDFAQYSSASLYGITPS
jgi:hypothetical protein